MVTTHWLGLAWVVDSSPSKWHTHGLLGVGGVPVVFSHGVGINAKETKLLRAHNQYLSITPESEMHYGHSHDYSHLAQDQAALGVDTHFTFSSDILTQARIWLQRTRSRLFDQVQVERWDLPRRNPSTSPQKPLRGPCRPMSENCHRLLTTNVQCP